MMSEISPHPTRIVVGRTNPGDMVDKGLVDGTPIPVKFTVTSRLIADIFSADVT